MSAILFVLLCAVELIAILSLNHGVFTYTLDDPYIHLALAEGIRAGVYGLNPGEASAPASSFLWPFLLAPFARLPFDTFVPLVLCFLASLGTIAITTRIVSSALTDVPAPARRTRAAILVTFLVIATNLVGLVFVGMEHSLQVLLSAALTWGLITELETGRMPRWLPVVLVLGPWVRYENVALSLLAITLLAWRRRFAVALGSLAGIVLGLGGFSLFLHSTGSGWLPLSILTKSGVVSGHSHPSTIVHNLRVNLRPGLPLLACGAALAALALRSGPRPSRTLAAWAAAAVTMHLLLGGFGWFARYEIYIWSVALLALVHVWRVPLGRWVARAPRLALIGVLAAILVVACRPYLRALVFTPLAANNIYEQQYQMRRFAVDLLGAPVGANDLGLVSYRNDHEVVDLEGLSSSETHRVRQGTTGAAWMDTLCARHGVRLAMIYTSVFHRVPDRWVRLGGLHLGRACITPGDSVVTFWAVDSAAAVAAAGALRAFGETLPPGVRFVVGGR